MTSHDLQQYLDKFLSVIGIERMLPKYIFILARGYQHIASDLVELVYTRNRTLFSQKQQSSQDQFHEVRKQSETFPLGQIFHEAIQLRETLNGLENQFDGVDDRMVHEMRRQTERFYAAFESFARNSEDKAFAEVLREAAYLYPSVVAARQIFSTLRQALGNETAPPAGRTRLTLHFRHTHSYTAVVEKLAALERTYSQLCEMTLVSATEVPLQSIRVEGTGPRLHVCLEGDTTVTEMLGTLFERFTMFLYRRLPSGGKGGVSDRVLATQSLVNLTDELERIDMGHILDDEARLQRVALSLRRDFVTLLAGSPSVRINDEEHEVDPSAWEPYIEESLHLLPRYSPIVHLEQTG